MRYLVTGATGFIGGRVARQLREAGHEVLAAGMVLGERLLPVPDAFSAEGLRETLAHEMRLLGRPGTNA